MISPALEETAAEQEYPTSRSASATSSLDPYYFGGSDSPVPPLPTPIHLSATPEHRSNTNDPVTPARDPASIDRRGLVGVGELATPRWARTEHGSEELIPVPQYDPDDFELREERGEESDSPWTIEAVDGESSEKEDVCASSPLIVVIFLTVS